MGSEYKRDMRYLRECFELVELSVGDCESGPDYWQARQSIESLATAVSRLANSLGIAEGCHTK